VAGCFQINHFDSEKPTFPFDVRLDAGALLVACLLILRSLLRAGHFDVSVYPSHAVLHNSFSPTF
jgi:hypothetical protein